jgi:hypothetical protein
MIWLRVKPNEPGALPDNPALTGGERRMVGYCMDLEFTIPIESDPRLVAGSSITLYDLFAFSVPEQFHGQLKEAIGEPIPVVTIESIAELGTSSIVKTEICYIAEDDQFVRLCVMLRSMGATSTYGDTN